MGGVFINLAFRQSLLVTKSAEPACWFFTGFYGMCVVVAYVIYLRRAPAPGRTNAAHRPSRSPRTRGRRRRLVPVSASVLRQPVREHVALTCRVSRSTRLQ